MSKSGQSAWITIGAAIADGRLMVDRTATHTYLRTEIAQPDGDLVAAPAHPWAVPIGDGRSAFRALVVDFDDTTAAPAAAATIDTTHPAATTLPTDRPATCAEVEAADLFGRCVAAGIPAILAESSPGSGRRHLWLLLGHAITAPDMAAVADLLGSAYPSADTGMLRNPVTGCLRFPGSPHRRGGTAQPLAIAVPSGATAADVLAGTVRAPLGLAAWLHHQLSPPAATHPEIVCPTAVSGVADTGDHASAAPTAQTLGDCPVASPTAAAGASFAVCRPGYVVDDYSLLMAAAGEAATALIAAGHRLIGGQVVTNYSTEAPRLRRRGLTSTAPQRRQRRAHRTRPTPPSVRTATAAGNTVAGHRHPSRSWIALVEAIAATSATHPDRTLSNDTLDAEFGGLDRWHSDDLDLLDQYGLRPLIDAVPAAARALLNPRHAALAEVPDASVTQWAGLAALLRAGATDDDICLLDTLLTPPVFTHSHSRRLTPTTRAPRTPFDRDARLRADISAARNSFDRHPGWTYQEPDTDPVPVVWQSKKRAVAAAVDHIYQWAQCHPAVAATLATITARKVLLAHLQRALAAADTTYYAGTRDLAADAAVASPQTALTYTRLLVSLGVLTIVDPSCGRRAHRYQLTLPGLVPPAQAGASGMPGAAALCGSQTMGSEVVAAGAGVDWTQGEPTPQTLHRTISGELSHHRHDVWAHKTSGPTALVAWHTLQSPPGTPTSDIAAACGLSEVTTRRAQTWLAEHDLPARPGCRRPARDTYIAAARALGVAGTWHARRTQWKAESVAHQWWCAELDWLRQSHAGRTPTGLLGRLGRYPRTADRKPDHNAAVARVHTQIRPTKWRAE